MMEAFLVPEKTMVSARGDGPAIDVSRADVRVFLLTLAITDIIEQESLDLTIYGSVDGATWDARPVAVFPQKFYREEVPLLLHLTERPDIKFIRAHWEVARWGRGSEMPMFEIGVSLREVPREILAEAEGRLRSG